MLQSSSPGFMRQAWRKGTAPKSGFQKHPTHPRTWRPAPTPECPAPLCGLLGRGPAMSVGSPASSQAAGRTRGSLLARRHSPTLGEAPAGHWPRLCGRVSTGQGRANESHVPGGRFPWDLGPRATEAPTRGPGHTSGCAGLRPRQPGTPRCTRAPGPQAAPSFAQSASHRGRPSGPESPHYRVIAILGERGDKPQEPLSQGPSD